MPLEKSLILFRIYTEERGISEKSDVLLNEIQRKLYPGGNYPTFLINIGTFCLHSLLGEIRPQFTQSYGTVPTDRENCDSNLTYKRLENIFRSTKVAADVGLIPIGSKPDVYIKALMDYKESILTSEYPQDHALQNNIVAFFYSRGLPVECDPPSKVEDITNYEHYANNITPFYMNPEKHPFLSPYNYDAYYSGTPVDRHSRILSNFCLLKKKKLITSYLCTNFNEEHIHVIDVNPVEGLELGSDYSKFSPDISSEKLDLYRNKICQYCYNAMKRTPPEKRVSDINQYILANTYLNFFWGVFKGTSSFGLWQAGSQAPPVQPIPEVEGLFLSPGVSLSSKIFKQ